METKEKKSELIVTSSKELFFKFGVKKVSVEEICSKCGISKKTFYQNFKNKYEVVKVILNEFAQIDHEQFQTVIKKDITFKEKIVLITKVKMEKYKSVESIFFNDVIENCTELKEHVANQLKENEREFFRFVVDEQKNNKLRTDLPAVFITHLLTVNANRLIFDSEIEKMFPRFNERVFKVADCLINGIENENGDLK